MNQERENWLEELRSNRQGKLIGRQIIFFQEIDSTNAYALAQARQGAAEGLVVLAESQSQGRGRLGRIWISPPGVNLYLSILLRPEIPLAKTQMITLMAGLATAKALLRVTGLEVRIKWPNDLLINGKKVAGILTEQDPSQKFIILGIGVNVNWAEIPAELQGMATSLYLEKGDKFSRAIISAELCAAIEEEYLRFLKGDFSAYLRTEWARLSLVDHKWVTIKIIDKEYTGLALGLDEDGALLVRDRDGNINRFLAGEVSLRF